MSREGDQCLFFVGHDSTLVGRWAGRGAGPRVRASLTGPPRGSRSGPRAEGLVPGGHSDSFPQPQWKAGSGATRWRAGARGGRTPRRRPEGRPERPEGQPTAWGPRGCARPTHRARSPSGPCALSATLLRSLELAAHPLSPLSFLVCKASRPTRRGHSRTSVTLRPALTSGPGQRQPLPPSFLSGCLRGKPPARLPLLQFRLETSVAC